MSYSRAVLIIAYCCATCLNAPAQQRELDFGGSFAVSPGTGFEPGVGLHVGASLPVNTWIVGNFEAEWLREPKAYLGDGQTARLRAEGRVYPLQMAGKWRPFVSAGVAYSSTLTSTYTKGAPFLTYGAGINYADQVIGYWRHYQREHQTANRVAADDIGVEFYRVLHKDSRWMYRAGFALQNTRFTQPTGSYAGQRSAWGQRFWAGLGFRF